MPKDYRTIRETTASDVDERRKPYTRPAVEEEEKFETYTLSCDLPKPACGTSLPPS